MPRYNENSPCWFTLPSQSHYKLSGADTKLWTQRILEGSSGVEYPPQALLKLFHERDKAEKETRRLRRANEAARKGNSRSLSSKDYSRERSNREKSIYLSIVNPQNIIQNQPVFAPVY